MSSFFNYAAFHCIFIMLSVNCNTFVLLYFRALITLSQLEEVIRGGVFQNTIVSIKYVSCIFTFLCHLNVSQNYIFNIFFIECK